MEKKKSHVGINIFIGVLLGIVICVVVSVSLYANNYIKFKDNNNQDDKVENTNKNEDNTTNSLDFNINNINNGNADSYTLADYNGTINITIDEAGQNATLSYNRKTLSDTYALNWDLTGVEEGVYENKTITFDKKINDVSFSGIGQDATGDVILFLMEDGTITYIPVYQVLSTNGIEGLTSYETINDLTDIVKFYTVDAKTDTSSSITVLAQAKDGTLYDLAPIINNNNTND